MEHKSISLPSKLWKSLSKWAKFDGISVGELVRKILTDWNDKPDGFK